VTEQMEAGGDHRVWSRRRMPLKGEPANREVPCCLSFEKVFHFPTEPPNQRTWVIVPATSAVLKSKVHFWTQQVHQEMHNSNICFYWWTG
jgi:hypothetical protein